MTSPMFTRGFSFGMVSPHEGVAYSLTAGVARGIFRQVVPIRQRLRGGRDGTLRATRGKEKRRAEARLFLNILPDFNTQPRESRLALCWGYRCRLLEAEFQQRFAGYLHLLASGQHLHARAGR